MLTVIFNFKCQNWILRHTLITGGDAMSKKRVLSVFFTLVILVFGIDAFAQTSKQAYEILRLIRHEKFDLIMPGAMRDNNVDM